MISGLHCPNASFKPGDHCRFVVGAGFQAAFLMYQHTNEQDVAILRGNGVSYFVMRLPDSVAPDGRWRGDVEWANLCIDLIKRFYPLGVKRFQLDNEPNLTWPLEHAGTWRWLTDRVIRRIRQSSDVPADVLVGLAPLAWKPDTWSSVENVWIPEQRKILDQFQWIAVHSYWQAAKHYNDPSFGGNVTHWRDALLPSEKPYVITEWASSIHETGLPAAQVEALRLVQYPQWLEWVRGKPYVEAAFLYILGGTPDWAGFWPTDAVLRVLTEVTRDAG